MMDNNRKVRKKSYPEKAHFLIMEFMNMGVGGCQVILILVFLWNNCEVVVMFFSSTINLFEEKIVKMCG